MLDIFRQRGLSNVIYGAVIVATIFAFVVTFRPQAQNRTASLTEACAARVRGRCIDPKDFSSAHRMLMPTRSESASRKLNLKKAALDGLIERELMDDDAKRLGLAVTDHELTEQLFAGYVRVSVPAADPELAQQVLSEMYQGYARAGFLTPETAQTHLNDRDTAIPIDFRDPRTRQFDMKLYERKVRNLSNRSTTEFREEQGRELLAAKVRDCIRDPVRIAESEAWDEYDRQKSTAMLTYIPVRESWAMRWAADVKPADVDLYVKDHPEAIEKALVDRKKEDAPKAGHIRHILVKLPYGASDEERAAALAKLSWAAARIKAGETFAEVARQTSDDTGSAAQGGDVGDKLEGFVPPFKAAAEALRPGETTSGAVETQYGFHYLEKDDPAKAAEVDDKLRRSVSRELVAGAGALELAELVAKRIDDSLRSGKPVEDAMKDAIAPYVHPERVEPLKVLPAPAGTAGDGGADGGEATAPKQPVATATFDASSDGDRPQTQTSSNFNRGGDPFPGLTPESTATLMRFAFSGKDGDVLEGALRTPEGFDVIVLKQHTQATRADFEKDRESFEQELLRSKRDEALSLYVRRLRDQAKDDIKVDESYIQEARADGGSTDEDEEEY